MEDTVDREECIIKDKDQQVSLTKKQEQQGTIEQLATAFSDQLAKFKRHRFNISHQYSHYRSLRQQMNDNECLVHIDFSENYVAKLASAISSAHYGASKHQITLRTGIYIRSSSKANPLCSLSDSLQHGPGAIWAHLDPVLDDIKTSYPAVDTVHFYSDGPTTLSTDKRGTSTCSPQSPMKMDSTMQPGISLKLATEKVHQISFYVSTLTRTADQIVAHGTDITSAFCLMIVEIRP